ncbi:MAG TPA: RNA polymerase sigma factor RpoH [Rhodopila sp.]|nr:RNA polymerase sigma factor RpoH [Rhodopila sp.]
MHITSVLTHADPRSDLTQYLQAIRKFPMLSPEEETDLARSWRDQQDVTAAHKLVTSHLRLVARIASRYRGYGLPLGELIGEGNIGLMQAVQRFDPDRGFRLATYAMWWIRAAINEYVLHSWSLVKMGTTSAQKKLFFNLRRLKSQMRAFEDRDLDPDQVAAIATTLGVSRDEVISMNRRLGGPDASLNATFGDDQDSQWQDNLVDDRDSPEVLFADQEQASQRSTLLNNALQTLRERERHILTERRLKDQPATLEQLAQQYGISRERVRQIEGRAFEKLQHVMRGRVADRRTAPPHAHRLAA